MSLLLRLIKSRPTAVAKSISNFVQKVMNYFWQQFRLPNMLLPCADTKPNSAIVIGQCLVKTYNVTVSQTMLSVNRAQLSIRKKRNQFESVRSKPIKVVAKLLSSENLSRRKVLLLSITKI